MRKRKSEGKVLGAAGVSGGGAAGSVLGAHVDGINAGIKERQKQHVLQAGSRRCEAAWRR